jgi:hypothetical protein
VDGADLQMAHFVANRCHIPNRVRASVLHSPSFLGRSRYSLLMLAGSGLFPDWWKFQVKLQNGRLYTTSLPNWHPSNNILEKPQ